MKPEKRNLAVLLYARSFQELQAENIENAVAAFGAEPKDIYLAAFTGTHSDFIKKSAYSCLNLSSVKPAKPIADCNGLRVLEYAISCEKLAEYEKFILIDSNHYFSGDWKNFTDRQAYHEGDATLFGFRSARIKNASYFIQSERVKRAASFLAKTFHFDDEDDVLKRFHLHDCRSDLFAISRIAATGFFARLQEITAALGKKRPAAMIPPEILFASELFHAGVRIIQAEKRFHGFFSDFRTPYRHADLMNQKPYGFDQNAVFYPALYSAAALSERFKQDQKITHSLSAAHALLRSLSGAEQYQTFGSEIRKSFQIGGTG